MVQGERWDSFILGHWEFIRWDIEGLGLQMITPWLEFTEQHMHKAEQKCI